MSKIWLVRIIAGAAGILLSAALAWAGPLGSPAVSISVPPTICGAGTSGCSLKTGPGIFYSAYVTTGATAGWLMLFNQPSTPSNGSTTFGSAPGDLLDCVAVGAQSTGGLSYSPTQPEPFGGTSSGLYIAFSSTGCGTLTLNTTAYLHASVQ